MSWLDANGMRKAAVTNAPRANTEMMLKALALDAYFEGVILGKQCVDFARMLRLMVVEPGSLRSAPSVNTDRNSLDDALMHGRRLG